MVVRFRDGRHPSQGFAPSQLKDYPGFPRPQPPLCPPDLAESASGQQFRQHRSTSAPSQVLVITSDITLAHLIKLEVERDRTRIHLAYDGVSGFLAVQENQPDLIIVDWTLSGVPATEFCDYLRMNSYQTPVLMLTETAQVGDRIASLDAGADDCLSKPFQFNELRAKVRAHLRRIGHGEFDILRFSNVTMDVKARDVHRDGESIYFTAREFDLLEYFMRHPNQVLTRTQILSQVWGSDFEGESNIVEVYVRNLRQKLESHHPKRLIQTMRGVGYVLRE